LQYCLRLYSDIVFYAGWNQCLMHDCCTEAPSYIESYTVAFIILKKGKLWYLRLSKIKSNPSTAQLDLFNPQKSREI
jgi:hypothetical protein